MKQEVNRSERIEQLMRSQRDLLKQNQNLWKALAGLSNLVQPVIAAMKVFREKGMLTNDEINDALKRINAHTKAIDGNTDTQGDDESPVQPTGQGADEGYSGSRRPRLLHQQSVGANAPGELYTRREGREDGGPATDPVAGAED